MRNFLLELRRAGRDMARHPGISLLAIVSVGIGLAVNAVLLRPIAIQAPGDLRRLWLKEGTDRIDRASWQEYESLREQAPAFRSLIAYSKHAAQVQTKQGQVFAGINYTSPNYFEALGLQPALGRVYSERFPEPAGVVLGQSAWLRHFAGDPSIVGQQIFVNRRAVTVLGVMRAEFTGLQRGLDVGIWASTDALLTTFRQEAIFRNPAIKDFELVLRLDPGVSDETMLGPGNQVIARLRQAGRGESERVLTARPFQESGLIRTLIISGVLAATVGLVLLVAALNVAKGRRNNKMDECAAGSH